MKQLRDNIEHRAIKIVDDFAALIDQPFSDGIPTITRSDLEVKTFRLMKMARAALIYLVTAVSVRERTEKKEAKLTLPMTLDFRDVGANPEVEPTKGRHRGKKGR